MKYIQYNFERKLDMRPHSVIVGVTGEKTSLGPSYVGIAFGEDDELLSVENREPTPEECGVSNPYDFYYRKTIGNPVRLRELIEANRIYAPHTMPGRYSSLLHLLDVAQFAASIGCADSLMRSICNLACRDDTVTILFEEKPYSFAWVMVNPLEHEQSIHNISRDGYILQSVDGSRYHGGLIAHRIHHHGEFLGKYEWSVHT